MIILTLALLTAVIYTHYRLPRMIADRRQLWATRFLLVVIGVAFGSVTLWRYAGQAPAPLLFLSAFALIHVPAAAILILKRAERRQRGEPLEPGGRD